MVKAYNKHGACCVFSESTAPRNILEALQDQLGDTGIVSCFISKVDYKEMIRHGLVPCPIFNGVEDDQFRKVLRYYREGFSDNEIAYWTGVLDSYDYLCKISIWSFTIWRKE